MDIIINPNHTDIARLCLRNRADSDADITKSVAKIIDDVAHRGDDALRHYALTFDGVSLSDIRLSLSKLQDFAAHTTERVRDAIDAAIRNIHNFHNAQRMQPIVVETMPGVRCFQRQVAIDTVGLYVPGGRAPLFSTVLMLAVPAKIAGCKRVVLCTPYSSLHGISPEIAYAALACGVHEIYGVGGAQAIAAMAYGTQSVPKVDKIFGPGNRYVTKAKQLVSSSVAIDMLAGPSEVMVMTDHTAIPAFVAADLLSQAEHGPDSQAILLTLDADFAKSVIDEVERQKTSLSRTESVEGSLNASHIVVLPSIDDMIAFANTYAPEHLIISMEHPWSVADRISAAGSVFIGNFSPESAGDYASGTNHTLPTSGLAHAYSGVNLDSFMKKITYQEISPDGLSRLSDIIITMADAEGLEAHAAAVKVRLNERSN